MVDRLKLSPCIETHNAFGLGTSILKQTPWKRWGVGWNETWVYETFTVGSRGKVVKVHKWSEREIITEYVIGDLLEQWANNPTVSPSRISDLLWKRLYQTMEISWINSGRGIQTLAKIVKGQITMIQLLVAIKPNWCRELILGSY